MFAGIGDQVCAEPTLRYVYNCKLKGEIEKIALASSVPDLYSHIKFDEVFTESFNMDEWLVCNTIPDIQGLAYEHISHGLTNCVDASTLYALRMTLPSKEKEIFITGKEPIDMVSDLFLKPRIVIHAGKHWPSKTFPKWWWDAVIDGITSLGHRPILVGANVDGNRTTVDVDAKKCFDLRGKTDIRELAWICQRARVVLTNDSSPLHMAASTDPRDKEKTGRAWIGTLATCKHFDYITHWRKNEWQWREKDFSKGWIGDYLGFLPNKTESVNVDKVENELLESWLPDPKEVSQWAISKLEKDQA
jgi:hypothetical protein